MCNAKRNNIRFATACIVQMNAYEGVSQRLFLLCKMPFPKGSLFPILYGATSAQGTSYIRRAWPRRDARFNCCSRRTFFCHGLVNSPIHVSGVPPLAAS